MADERYVYGRRNLPLASAGGGHRMAHRGTAVGPLRAHPLHAGLCGGSCRGRRAAPRRPAVCHGPQLSDGICRRPDRSQSPLRCRTERAHPCAGQWRRSSDALPRSDGRHQQRAGTRSSRHGARSGLRDEPSVLRVLHQRGRSERPARRPEIWSSPASSVRSAIPCSPTRLPLRSQVDQPRRPGLHRALAVREPQWRIP